jgi:hypothetical protein
VSTLETSITNQAQKILLGCGILSSVLYFAGWERRLNAGLDSTPTLPTEELQL